MEAIYGGYSCAFKSEINYQEKLKSMLDKKGLLQQTLELSEKLMNAKNFFKLKKFFLKENVSFV